MSMLVGSLECVRFPEAFVPGTPNPCNFGAFVLRLSCSKLLKSEGGVFRV